MTILIYYFELTGIPCAGGLDLGTIRGMERRILSLSRCWVIGLGLYLGLGGHSLDAQAADTGHNRFYESLVTEREAGRKPDVKTVDRLRAQTLEPAAQSARAVENQKLETELKPAAPKSLELSVGRSLASGASGASESADEGEVPGAEKPRITRAKREDSAVSEAPIDVSEMPPELDFTHAERAPRRAPTSGKNTSAPKR